MFFRFVANADPLTYRFNHKRLTGYSDSKPLKEEYQIHYGTIFPTFMLKYPVVKVDILCNCHFLVSWFSIFTLS